MKAAPAHGLDVATRSDHPMKSASDMHEIFRRVATKTAHGVGTPWAFTAALLIVVGWGFSGPVFKYSDTWQLVINTSTTIVTFLMVFLIQNTQNRDSMALHMKLDELIRANDNARNRLMGVEDLSEHEIAELQSEFDALCERKRASKKNAPLRKAS